MDKSELKANKEVWLSYFLNSDLQDSKKVKKLSSKWHNVWMICYIEGDTDLSLCYSWLFGKHT